ncbi:hypothetical protein P3X46_031868 [Hevea brasiliensis]|uniref:Uncharacterized protein n=1 Tax=Hevea brasiliensis TaxID=3981 RepID=A0ABQ9KLQ4_HEVBR|nr:uncharacterized protein LOC110672571 [Hevea brasiliensis]KAJ9141320.1 hypothetical protein P3X46_031868 [Hevea brasiliensis]KAJ9141321.1 hypothetical protein P3X46_031868 [Hevea brasiliensis]KAJ9141322.1 hypothetical protein P3X46_031868 [Hevea brasiliensis]
MARILSGALLRHCNHSSSLPIKYPPLVPLSFQHRHRSSKPQLIEIDLAALSSSKGSSSSNSASSSSSDGGGGDDDDGEMLMMQKLEDMIQRVMLQKSTPDWLPFLPGSSFWVAPHHRPLRLGELVVKLFDQLNHEESLSLITSRGWPCSAFFIPDSTPRKADLEFNVGGMEVKVDIEEEEVNGEAKMQYVEDSDSNDKKG